MNVTLAKNAEAFLVVPSILCTSEHRVLNLISQAKTNKEMAAALHISPATVKRHLVDILRTLQLRNRVEAATYGLMMKACSPGMDSQCPLALWYQTVLKENRRP